MARLNDRLTIILLTTISIFANCNLHNQDKIKDSTVCDCRWGMEVYTNESDSIRFVSPGKDFTANCFPNDFLKGKEVVPLELVVINRYGKTFFQTETFDSNWICNECSNYNYVQGTYYYLLEYKILNSDSIYSFSDRIFLECKENKSI